MKKVLIIAYHFPPDSQVGGIRPAKFAKYLPKYGWEAHILTIKDKYIDSTDYTRLKEVENVSVTKTAIFPTLMDIILYVKRLFTATKLDNSHYTATETVPDKYTKHRQDSLLKRSLNSLLESPDKQFGWFIPAIWSGMKIIRKEKIDVILTTAPPATVSFLGLALSYLTGKKLVTDLRDPLILHKSKAPSHQTWLSNKIEILLEQKLYQKSSLVISATDKHSSFFKAVYGDKYPNKFYPIWNGFDSSDFNELSTNNNKKTDKFTINYIGSFYASRSPAHFLQAVHNLISDSVISKDEIEINFIGNVEETSEGATIKLIKRHELDDCVNLQGQIPYRQALLKMSEADVLLLIAPADMNQYAVPAKAFEYMYANGNILCLSNNSPTGDLILQLECGKVADVFSIEEITECIKQFHTEWKNNELQTGNSKITMFERKYQTKKLAKLLDTLN